MRLKLHYNTGTNPRFTLCDIDDEKMLLIDPDTVFWSLISKKRDLDSILKHEVLHLYKEFKDKLTNEMHEFRFNSNLTAVYINPSDRCNADCSYCYIPFKMRKNGLQMSKGQLEITLTKIADYFQSLERDSKAKPVIVFHGSEPLLAKDAILSVIESFGDHFHFGIQTNGLLLEEGDVDFLKRHGVSVGLSLDSPQRETNDLLRKTMGGTGTYDKVVQVIGWFNGYEGLSVISTITKYNVDQLPELVNFLHDRKVPTVLLNPVRGTSSPARSLKPDQERLLKYFIDAVEKAIKLSRASEKRIIIGNFANTILGIIAPTARRLMCDITPCGGGRCFFAITAGGDLIPCGEFSGFEEFRGGNIFSSKIQDAMDSKAFKEVRSRIVERIDYCNTCAFRNICGAPCPAEVYSIEGDMYHPSPYCEFYEMLIRYAFRLIGMDKVKYLFRDEAMKNLEYEYKLVKAKTG